MVGAISLFLPTHRKLETQALEVFVVGSFSLGNIFTKREPFCHFYIIADANFPFLLTLGKPETQTVGGGGSVIGNFILGCILQSYNHFSHMITFLQLKVHNGWGKFFIGSVFLSILGSISTFKCGYA